MGNCRRETRRSFAMVSSECDLKSFLVKLRKNARDSEHGQQGDRRGKEEECRGRERGVKDT